MAEIEISIWASQSFPDSHFAGVTLKSAAGNEDWGDLQQPKEGP